MHKQFPILHCPGLPSIPWDMIAPHEKQAWKNHGQTIERLAERGGLGAGEALAVLNGVAHRSIGDVWPDEVAATRILYERAEAWKTSPDGEIAFLTARAEAAETRAEEAEARVAVMVEVLKCRRCNGTGMRPVHCWKCDDSGEDHDDCPDDVPCDDESHKILANLPASVAADLKRREALEEVAEAAQAFAGGPFYDESFRVVRAALSNLAAAEKGGA